MASVKNYTPFFKFLVTSGIATAANLLARIGFSTVFSYEIAVVLAHIVGMIIAYILSRIFVFEESGQSIKREFIGFTIVNVISLLQVWVISVSMYRFFLPQLSWTYEPALVAHFTGVASLIFTSYFLHKHISFKKA